MGPSAGRRFISPGAPPPPPPKPCPRRPPLAKPPRACICSRNSLMPAVGGIRCTEVFVPGEILRLRLRVFVRSFWREKVGGSPAQTVVHLLERRDGSDP